MRLPPELALALSNAGWSPSYVFNVESVLAGMRSQGLSVNDAGEAFLRSFGGLEFECVSDYGIRTHPLAASRLLGARALRIYESWVGLSLMVVGKADGGNSTLMIDELGRLYTGTDSFLARLGESLDAGLESLCLPAYKRQVVMIEAGEGGEGWPPGDDLKPLPPFHIRTNDSTVKDEHSE